MPNPRCTTFCNNLSLIERACIVFKRLNLYNFRCISGFSNTKRHILFLCSQHFAEIPTRSEYHEWVVHEKVLILSWEDGLLNITPNKIFVQRFLFHFLTFDIRTGQVLVSRSCSGFLGMWQKTSAAVLYKTPCFPYFNALFRCHCVIFRLQWPPHLKRNKDLHFEESIILKCLYK